MPTKFRPYAPDQDLLLPSSLKEWLPEDHAAYFISEMVEELDLKAFYAPYEGDGRRRMPYEPKMMLKVLLYGYVSGVFSSRKMAAKLEEDVAFRVLAAGNFPSHRTICEFRKRHLADFKALFVQVVQIAQAAGLVKLGTVAVDGTKVKANASKRKAMSYQRMLAEERRIQRAVDELCDRAHRVDQTEDARYGEDRRGDELPEELRYREDRLNKIREAKAQLEAKQREADRKKGRHEDDDRRPPSGRGRSYQQEFGVPKDKDQTNFTDPESQIMKTAQGYEQCYNGQVAVDDEQQMIVGNSLSANASDQGALLGLLDQIKTILKGIPDRILADAGYRNERDFEALESAGIDGYISVGREGKACQAVDPDRHPATGRMVDKLATAEGREQYKARKHLVEAVPGWIKNVLGFRQFSVRGLEKVSGEWDLVCLATNLRRMHPRIVFE